MNKATLMRNRLNKQIRIVVYVDGPNADNQAAAWGAWRRFFDERGIEVIIIVEATAVNYAPNAPLGSRDIELSRRIHLLHTGRMAGLASRGKTGMKVFLGQDIADTKITSPIPHNAHVKHEDYDIFEDAHRRVPDFAAAMRYLQDFDGITHVVVGGPFSSIPALIDLLPAEQLGVLACQAGTKLSKRAIYSKLAFNGEVDLSAFTETYLRWPNLIAFVPSDITRAPEVTFTGADELRRLGVTGEIFEIFLKHRERAAERHKREQEERAKRGEKMRDYPALSIHDLQAVLVLEQILGWGRGYDFVPVNPDEAVQNLLTVARHWKGKGIDTGVTSQLIKQLGYAGKGMLSDGSTLPSRIMVDGQDAAHYKRQVALALR